MDDLNYCARLSDFTECFDSNGQSQSNLVASEKNYENAVAIVLGYFNDNRFIKEQIASIFSQSHPNISVFVSDDCSHTSFENSLLELTPDQSKSVSVSRTDSNVGFCHNFLGALATVDKRYEYFAFSDQDDVWYADKIASALAVLSQCPANTPALYCARTLIFDKNCETRLGVSPLFPKSPSFANALVQNIGGGNTMVFNRAARDLIIQSIQQDTPVISHDWWCYQIVSGAGGMVYYDSKPCLKYRQHGANLVGSNCGWAARLVRIRQLLSGRFRSWNDVNLKALSVHRNLLTPENQSILDHFMLARHSSLIKRLILCRRAGIYRQTLLGTVGLFIGLLFNKV